MGSRPDILLLGSGVGDTLQLTVESQRALAGVGRAYSLALPPTVRRYLGTLGVECVDLAERVPVGRSFAEAYLEIGEAILQEALDDPPVAVIAPGNPLLSNALNRFLITRARELKLRVQVLPGVSPIDTLVCLTGLDVGTFGLQIFDARRIVARRQPIDPGVPLLVLQLAGVAAIGMGQPVSHDSSAYAPLIDALGRSYPRDHPVTHVGDGSPPGAARLVTVPLERFAELVPHFGTGSTLFVDLVRHAPGTAAAPG